MHASNEHVRPIFLFFSFHHLGETASSLAARVHSLVCVLLQNLFTLTNDD